MNAALAAENVVERYGDVAALSGVSLSVDPGETFALIGPNGAGKTTLVRALLGTITPDEGRATLFGDDPRAVDPERIGLLPQAFDPPGRLTARELVAYYGGLYESALSPDEALAAVGLDGVEGTWYEDLSGGEKRRTCVACTLVNEPELLVLDEPTTAIDPAGRRSLWRLLEELADGGTTIFLTTHDMAEAERLGDRVGLLSDGELVAVGSPEELVDDYGGEGQLVVSTEATPDALSDTDFPVESTDRGLVVRGVTPNRVDRAVSAVAASGIEYDALRWSGPTLEDAYLELTGERFAGRPRTGAAPVSGGDSA